ncbi:hypothetical protein ACHAWX_001263 [Stephanocyclus meneghinianus]
MRVLQSSRNYETDRKLPISYVKSCDVAGDDKSTDSCSPTALYGLHSFCPAAIQRNSLMPLSVKLYPTIYLPANGIENLQQSTNRDIKSNAHSAIK